MALFTHSSKQLETQWWLPSFLFGPRDYHTKWSKPDRERQVSYDITYMWNLKIKNDTNELIYKTEINPQTQKTNLLLPKGKSGGEG